MFLASESSSQLRILVYSGRTHQIIAKVLWLSLTKSALVESRLLTHLVKTKAPWTIRQSLIPEARSHPLPNSWEVWPSLVVHPQLITIWLWVLVCASSHVEMSHLVWRQTVAIHTVFLVAIERHPPLHSRKSSLALHAWHHSLGPVLAVTHPHSAHFWVHLSHLAWVASSERHTLIASEGHPLVPAHRHVL